MRRLMTGARPTGSLHIGQFFAAFEPFVNSDQQDGSFFIVSDLHMLTTKFTPAATKGLPYAVRRLVAEAIGFGVDPTKTQFYLQSAVPWQARIYVILQSLALKSRLERHGSFQEMASASEKMRPPTLGLLGYPILESSDVISIGATHVTVGESNRSHFGHLTELLEELNRDWGTSYVAPKVLIGRPNLVGIDGSAKMSKSLGNAIFFSDSNDTIRNKVRLMVARDRAGAVVPACYLEALSAPADLVKRVQEAVDAIDELPSWIQDELTERLIALVEPVNQSANAALSNVELLDDILRMGSSQADSLGAAAYDRLTSNLGMLRIAP